MSEENNGKVNKKNQVMLTIILFLGILAVSGVIILFMGNQKTTPGRRVRIVLGNDILYNFDLDAAEDTTFTVESPKGKNVVCIKSHEISVIEADCPDGVCVGMGVLEENYLPIVCLPHEFFIEFVEMEQ